MTDIVKDDIKNILDFGVTPCTQYESESEALLLIDKSENIQILKGKRYGCQFFSHINYSAAIKEDDYHSNNQTKIIGILDMVLI